MGDGAVVCRGFKITNLLFRGRNSIIFCACFRCLSKCTSAMYRIIYEIGDFNLDSK